jgi:hypothetical protein
MTVSGFPKQHRTKATLAEALRRRIRQIRQQLALSFFPHLADVEHQEISCSIGRKDCLTSRCGEVGTVAEPPSSTPAKAPAKWPVDDAGLVPKIG